MKIDNRFVIFKTLAGYKNAQRTGNVMDDSIVFVIENRGIYTHGIQFGIDAHNKGFVGSVDKLPAGEPGDCATVKEGNKWFFYYYDATRGWVKGQECTIPDISQDTLDQYLKKVNIREYLHHEYDNTYVRRDEVYTPDQEDWINPDDSDRDEWQWDEDGNLYRIDAEFSTTSRNSLQNRVVTNELHNVDARTSTVEQLVTMCNVPKLNDYVVDIVFKEGVTNPQSENYIDLTTQWDSIDITYKYRPAQGAPYINMISLKEGNNVINLFYKEYTTADAAQADMGVLLESDYCYLVLRKISDTGINTLQDTTIIFNKDVQWNSVNEHSIIKELLIERNVPTANTVYTKDQTYSKAEVDALIEELRQELQPNSNPAV